ncbi:MAG: hypothetical protein ACYC6A_13010 [Armatimonadota bacterium]
MKRIFRWAFALETLAVVLCIVAVKYLVHHFDLDTLQLNALFSSIIAGGIFIIGVILAGTLSDFKECEKIPAELVASLENIHEEGVRVRAMHPLFNLDALRGALLEIVDAFHHDLADLESNERACLAAISRLTEHFSAMEACGLAPNFVVRLKTEQGNIRKQVLRVYHIQRTGFLPSAYVLVDAIILLVIVVLLLAHIDHVVTALVQLGFISYLFIYMVKLLRAIDRPFRVNEQTMDDVSRFLLKEFAARLRGEMPQPVSADSRTDEWMSWMGGWMEEYA